MSRVTTTHQLNQWLEKKIKWRPVYYIYLYKDKNLTLLFVGKPCDTSHKTEKYKNFLIENTGWKEGGKKVSKKGEKTGKKLEKLQI